MNKKENPYLEEIQKAQNKIKPKKVEGDGLPSWLPKLKEGIQFVETSTENSSRKKQVRIGNFYFFISNNYCN